MKSWKKRWKEELDVALSSNSSKETVTYQTKKSFKRRFFAFTSLAITCALLITCVVYFSLFTPPASATPYVFSVEINPKVCFTVDEKGVISDITSCNADADVILSSQDRFEKMLGKAPDEAVKTFVDYAIVLGYFENNGDAMRITSTTDFAEVLQSSITEHLRKRGVLVAVVSEQAKIEVISERLGVENTETVEEFIEKINQRENLFSNSTALDNTLEDVRAQYNEQVKKYLKSKIDNSQIPENLKDFFNGAIDDSDISEIVEDLKQFGLIDDDVDGLMNFYAEDKDLYAEKCKELNEKIYFEKTGGKNEIKDEDFKPEISEKDYNDFIEDKKGSFGSIDDFFNSKHNKK